MQLAQEETTTLRAKLDHERHQVEMLSLAQLDAEVLCVAVASFIPGQQLLLVILLGPHGICLSCNVQEMHQLEPCRTVCRFASAHLPGGPVAILSLLAPFPLSPFPPFTWLQLCWLLSLALLLTHVSFACPCPFCPPLLPCCLHPAYPSLPRPLQVQQAVSKIYLPLCCLFKSVEGAFRPKRTVWLSSLSRQRQVALHCLLASQQQPACHGRQPAHPGASAEAEQWPAESGGH